MIIAAVYQPKKRYLSDDTRNSEDAWHFIFTIPNISTHPI